MKVLLLLFLLLTAHGARAAYVENIPRRLTQPDGSQLVCLQSGDEFFNYLHDAKGYTIIRGEDGFYYYAQLREGVLEATSYRADSTDPDQVGLKKRATISPQDYQRRKAERQALTGKASRAPLTGDMTNLVVYIRFSDDDEFVAPRSHFDQNFNDEQGPSLYHYFQEVSYDQLEIKSHHFPLAEMTTNLSYQDTNERAYYEPFHAVTNPIGYDPEVPLINSTDPAGLTYREHTLLASAIAYIEGQVPDQLVIDADNNGQVDNISFIIRGEPGEWNNLLWAHRWALWSQTITLNNKIVYDYTLQPETQSGIFVICHEMYHTLGAPDLYRYSQSGFTPVGPWDLMASGFVHMGAWMKYRYARGKWIKDLPVISEPGTYTLEPLYAPQNNGFRVISPNNEQEFFVLEYRRRQGHYESNIPGEGLVIYRINPTVTGNALGPPDEVYIFRPGGDTLTNGNIFEAFFSLESGRTTFHDNSQPAGFLQDGSPAGLFITNISMAGETISFDLYPLVEGALPPQNLVAETTADYDVVLSWDSSGRDTTAASAPLLTGYQIFRDQQLLATLEDSTQTTFVDQSPAAGVHSYFIRATYNYPQTVSYGTNIVNAEVPPYFSFAQGPFYKVGWEEGSITLDMNTNVSAWQVSSSATWCQPATLIGNFSSNLLVMHAANPYTSQRTAQITFAGTILVADTVITVQQQGHPTLVATAGQPPFSIYPNPVVQGPLRLVFHEPVDEATLEIFSPQGSRIMHATIQAATGQTLDVATGSFAPGAYLLVIRLKEQTIRKKFMILK